MCRKTFLLGLTSGLLLFQLIECRTLPLQFLPTHHAPDSIHRAHWFPMKESTRTIGTSQMRKRSPRGVDCAGLCGVVSSMTSKGDE
jgi:hypothetical protein